MQKITTFLTFNNQAEEAAEFYTSIFKHSTITNRMKLSPDAPAISVSFELEGQQYTALNGGPTFSFSQGISLFVSCQDQTEIDYLWSRLSEGGEEQQCGWLKDKFGVSWQIIPPILGRLLGSQDAGKAKRTLDAMLKMKKIDIKTLEEA